MTNALVKLWGTTIGYVSYDEADPIQPALFEYDKNFISSGIPLSPIAMPLSTRVYSFPELNEATYHHLPGLLADSLPDKFGNQIFQSWLNAHGKQAMNPVEQLCYLGTRGMGALEYFPDTGSRDKWAGMLPIEIDSLRQVASDILTQRASFKGNVSAMEQLIKIGTSAGGARAKAIIAWNEETGEVRSGQVKAEPGFSYWLLKFDGIRNNGDDNGPDSHQYTRIELAYYYMATHCGIQMMPTRILENNGYYHFLTQRFDRDQKTGDKRHMQSLCGLAHIDFNTPGICSYEYVAQIAHKIGCPQADIEELFRRMVFNVFARNQDDHTKNISFLMDRQGKWSLSPAYDICYANKPGNQWLDKHQMSINGKRSGFLIEDFLICAEKMSIRSTKAKKIIAEIQKGVRQWKTFAEMANLDSNFSDEIWSNLYT